jgi:NAD(P)-dependent dehydrogenase (short-subunit alcohol dehydrogenase family)
MQNFKNKRVLITGAGSGLGRALSLEFARLGWDIAVSDIDESRAEETMKLVNDAGGGGFIITCDVTRPADWNKCFSSIKKEWGALDILVNNAGVAHGALMEDISVKEWDWIIQNNLKSVVLGCRTFIPMFKQQKGGYIINVSSSSGLVPLPEMSCYSVTKAGVFALSEIIRFELGQYGVGVSVAAPTFFKTHLYESIPVNESNRRTRIKARAYFDNSKITAEEVAREIIAAISKRKFYIIVGNDAKLGWFLKRLFPEWFINLVAREYARDELTRFLKIKNPVLSALDDN